MNTCFATSPDLIRIAYDVSGKGPAITLLHGGGSSRQEWHPARYVKRLKYDFTIIMVDIREHGESDKPIDPACYTVEKMGKDFLAVADACGVESFAIWAYSFGGIIGRYLVAQSNHGIRMVIIGFHYRWGVSGEWRKLAEDFRIWWAPILRAQTGRAGGKFDPLLILAEEQQVVHQLSFPGELVPVVLAWSSVRLDWPSNEPADMRCPTLWLFGSENKIAADSYEKFQEALKQSRVEGYVREEFTHSQEFDEVDWVNPIMFAFART